MATLDEIAAIITADPKGFIAAMNEIHAATDTTTKHMSDQFNAVGTLIDTAITASLLELAHKAMESFDQASHNAALLASEIKATGDSSGFSADQLDRMANNLSVMSQFGKQDILQSVTLSLLQFRQISGDTFSRAQQDIVNWASTGKVSLQEASIVIGRALDNPTMAFSALRRAHIDLEPQQRTMIANLMNEGKTAEAQQVILSALEKRYNGVAETMKNIPSEKIKKDFTAIDEAMAPFGATIERMLVPMLNALANVITFLSDKFKRLSPFMQDIIIIGLAIVPVIGSILVAIGFLGPAIATVTTAIGALEAVGAPVFAIIGAILLGLVVFITEITVATKQLMDNWNALRDSAHGVWSFIKAAVEVSVLGILEVLSKIPGMGSKVSDAIAQMKKDIATNMTDSGSSIRKSMGEVVTFKDSMIDLKNKALGAFDGLTSGLKQGFQDIGKAGKTTAASIPPPWVTAFNQVENFGKLMTDNLQKSFDDLAKGLSDTLTVGAQDWQSLIGNALQNMLKAFIDWGVKAMMVALNVADAMNALFADPLAAVAVIGGLIALTSAIKTAPKMAAGGVVDQPTMAMIGESGPEVVLPVTRLSTGKMGVQVQQPGPGSSAQGSLPIPVGGAGPGAKEMGMQVIQVMLDSKPILKAVSKASRTGGLVIHPNAVRVVAVNP